jgi:hypothetical protein
MNQMRLRAAAIIIALVVLAGFLLSVPRARDGELPLAKDEAFVTPEVSLRDVFKKGVHTITGSLKGPNACASATATASVLGDAAAPTGIVVAIALTQTEGVCLQLPTTIKFSTTISAPAKLPLSASVNGNSATTTVL